MAARAEVTGSNTPDSEGGGALRKLQLQEGVGRRLDLGRKCVNERAKISVKLFFLSTLERRVPIVQKIEPNIKNF
jgi:hypothetical protein